MVLSGWRKWANGYSMGGLGLLEWCFGSLGLWESGVVAMG